MSPTPVFLAWSGVLMAAAWRHRPPPARIRALSAPDSRATADQRARPSVGASLGAIVERLGSAVLRRCGRQVPAETARRLGSALLWPSSHLSSYLLLRCLSG